MADRTSSILNLPLTPLVEDPKQAPEVVESGAVNIEVTVVTVKSAGGIQTTKID